MERGGRLTKQTRVDRRVDMHRSELYIFSSTFGRDEFYLSLTLSVSRSPPTSTRVSGLVCFSLFLSLSLSSVSSVSLSCLSLSAELQLEELRSGRGEQERGGGAASRTVITTTKKKTEEKRERNRRRKKEKEVFFFFLVGRGWVDALKRDLGGEKEITLLPRLSRGGLTDECI